MKYLEGNGGNLECPGLETFHLVGVVGQEGLSPSILEEEEEEGL